MKKNPGRSEARRQRFANRRMDSEWKMALNEHVMKCEARRLEKRRREHEAV